jgi:seryl-tRNA synthetase
MLDIRKIRSEPDAVKAALAKRGESPDRIDALLALDEKRRQSQTAWEQRKAEQNGLGPQIAAAKKAGADATELLARSNALKTEIQAIGETLSTLDTEQEALLGVLPNLPLADVPAGGEENNLELRGADRLLRAFDFEPKAHWDLGTALGLFDFERGARLAGSGFVVYTGIGARLERALIQMMLDLHTIHHGYTEVAVPFVLNRDSITASAHIVKFLPEMYHDTEDDLFLIPTAEPALVNLHRGELLDPGTLPLKYVSHTPCWRREAGAAGRDTRGLLRVHQFDKVELFRYVAPEDSPAAQAEMVHEASAVLDVLELPHRQLLLAAGDTGFAMARTVDLETWAPGVGKWLEVSSASDGGDFQARRGNIRFRRETGSRPEFPHLLNASGTALPRVLATLLETHQNPDGSVTLPAALRPYLGGRERLEPKV